MAKKATHSAPENHDPELVVPRNEARSKIQERIDKGKNLFARQIQTLEELKAAEDEYYKWTAYNTELLKRIFNALNFANEYSFYGVEIDRSDPLPEQLRELRDGIDDRVHRLESIMERLDLIPVAYDVAIAVQPQLPKKTVGNRVFLVHGHDEAARETVARFLEKIGLKPVILHEQASAGKTIIEKLECHSDVDFAVVLLTPDDLGAAVATRETLNPRARQNVVLELGYFVGKLGRNRVCALHREPLELPSDVLGVVYVPLDEGGGWRLLVARELRQAGIDVDMNAAL